MLQDPRLTFTAIKFSFQIPAVLKGRIKHSRMVDFLLSILRSIEYEKASDAIGIGQHSKHDEIFMWHHGSL